MITIQRKEGVAEKQMRHPLFFVYSGSFTPFSATAPLFTLKLSRYPTERKF